MYDFNLVHYTPNTVIFMLDLMFHQKVMRYIVFLLCLLRDICLPEYNQMISNPQQLRKINVVNLTLQKKVQINEMLFVLESHSQKQDLHSGLSTKLIIFFSLCKKSLMLRCK